MQDEDRMRLRVNGARARNTSDDGQLCRDGHLSLAVACHALVDVLVSWSSEWLYPQHGAGSLIELNSLDSQRTTQGAGISHS